MVHKKISEVRRVNAKREPAHHQDVVPKRRFGRPDTRGSQELDSHILNTAARLFIEQGYASTSIEQIALKAGSGKQSIYRRYSSKEMLFKAVIDAQIDMLFELTVAAEAGRLEPLSALREVCRTLLDFVSDKDVIGTYRILIAEAERFPGLIEFARLEGEGSHQGNIRRLLRAAVDAGQIREGQSIDRLCHALIGLSTGWTLNQGLLGSPHVMDAAERAAQFEANWDIFLRGVETDSSRASESAIGTKERP